MLLLPPSPRSRGLFFFALLCACSTAQAAPYRPTDDAQVLEQLPAGLGNIGARSAPGPRPDDPTLAVALGHAYIERARREADPRFLGYAEAALAPYAAVPQPIPDVLLLEATLAQSRHRFDDALALLDRLAQRYPDAPQAWLTRATILRVQGRYPEALAACERVTTGASFAGTVCTAAVRGMAGELAVAHAQLQSLIAAATHRPAAERAWHAAELADAAERLGHRVEAEQTYLRALQEFPEDWQLRAAYADLLLDAGRPAEALALTASRDRVDALLLRTLLAQVKLGRADAAVKARVADAFAAARRRGEELHLREEARYELEVLHDAPRALELAQQNWAIQREPWDVRLLVAAAAAARDAQTLASAKAWLKDTGLEDARVISLLAAAGDAQ